MELDPKDLNRAGHDPMLHPSTQKLIDRLAAMTAQKKIDWIEKDNGDVLYATEGYVVSLTAEPPRVLLTTANGKSLEDASAALLNSAPHKDGATYGDLVASIARNACREARGTEAAINTLLAGLGDEEAAAGLDAASIAAGTDITEEAADETEDTGEGEATIEDSGDETALLASGIAPAVTTEAEAPEPETLPEPETTEVEAETAQAETIGPDAVVETPGEADTDTFSETEAEAYEDAPAAVEADAETPVGPDAVAEEPLEADTETEPQTETEAETAFTSSTDEMSEDLVDVSVPEAALLEPEDIEADDEEAAFVQPEGSADTYTDEDDVSGAVARLADEVNRPQESAAATEFASADTDTDTDTGLTSEPDTPEADEAADDVLAATPMPSFSVTPDDAQSAQFDEDTDEIADASSGPIETEADSVEDFVDEVADDTFEAAEAPSDEIETAAAPEPATAEMTESPDVAADEPAPLAPAWSAIRSNSTEAASAPVNSPFEDTPAAGDDADVPEEIFTTTEIETTPEPEAEAEEDITTFAADSAETESVEAETSEPETITPETIEPVIAATVSNVRYVPFGAGGIEAAGADASDEAPADDEIESELGAASSSMSLPDEAIDVTADTEDPVAAMAGTEPEAASEDDNISAFPTLEDADIKADDALSVSSDDTPPAGEESETPRPTADLSLSGLSAGLGFGTKSYAFQPSPPKPAETARPAESVSQAHVIIDATDDFPHADPGDFASDVSDVSGLDVNSAADQAASLMETPASAEDVDAVAPQETVEAPEKALSLVSADGEEEQQVEEEPAPPTRPKTRFNPWT